MPKTPLMDVPRSPDSHGECRARGHVVRYRRSGAGRPLLLLHSPERSPPLWPEVLEVLRSGFRLVVPDPPPRGTEAEAWLSALLDGLGLSGVTVVAFDEFCIAALERALLEPDRVARVVMVVRGRGSEAVVAGSIDSIPRLASVPLLVLRHDRSAAEVLPVVASFLERSGSVSGA